MILHKCGYVHHIGEHCPIEAQPPTPDTSPGDELLDILEGYRKADFSAKPFKSDLTEWNESYSENRQKILAEAKDRLNRLMLQARIDEVKNCREGFVIGYQRYEGNEAADKFLRTVIEAFDERIATLDAQLNKEEK